jgi:hypothetical protein
MIRTKRIQGVIEDTSGSAEEYPGTFEVVLSTEAQDRDGDTLKAEGWEQPFPSQITFVNDHTHKMSSVVGSATPTLEDGQVVCRGTWAETDNAQETRKVIKHVPYVSVAYREKASGKRELINGSFVVVPSNPEAKVLASKGFGVEEDELTDEAKAFIKAIVDEALTVKAADGKTDASEQLPAPDEAPSQEADPTADQDREKALALAAARISQFQTKDYV